MLASLVALVMLMPVSYRAGADVSHSHTIFQGLIDTIVGQPHHHGGPVRDRDDLHAKGDTGHAGTRSQGEHGPGQRDDRAAERLEPNYPAPDMPTWLGLSNPIDATTAIHALGALVTALAGGSARRSLGNPVRRLTGLSLTLEPPPPRLT